MTFTLNQSPKIILDSQGSLIRSSAPPPPLKLICDGLKIARIKLITCHNIQLILKTPKMPKMVIKPVGIWCFFQFNLFISLFTLRAVLCCTYTMKSSDDEDSGLPEGGALELESIEQDSGGWCGLVMKHFPLHRRQLNIAIVRQNLNLYSWCVPGWFPSSFSSCG